VSDVPGGLLRDCERVVGARCGNEALKVSISSSFGFWELVLQRGQVRYKSSTRATRATRTAQQAVNKRAIVGEHIPISKHRWEARSRRARCSRASRDGGEVGRWGRLQGDLMKREFMPQRVKPQGQGRLDALKGQASSIGLATRASTGSNGSAWGTGHRASVLEGRMG